MLKMVKYEYRKNLFPLLVVFIIFGGLQIYFTLATMMKNETHSAISASLLMMAAFCAYLFVLIYGVATYNSDLKNKSGYLVFMAPISTYQVIGAKLLSTLLTGVTLVALIGVLGVVDYSFAAKQYGFEDIIEFIKYMFESNDIAITTILLNVLVFVVVMLIEFFMTITVAYFAISLCSTALQNNKFKGFVSFILFVVLTIAISVIASKLPRLIDIREAETFLQSMYSMLPQIGLYLVVMIASFIGSGMLLDKQISL